MNKKNVIRCLAVCLVFLMILPFAACSPKGPGGSKETARPISDTSVTYKAELPDTKYNGATFTVGGVEPDLYPSITLAFDYEEPQEEAISDSIYKRNRKIESTLDITFVNEYVGDHMMVLTVFTDNVMADDDIYQLIMLINRHAFSQAVAGYALRPDQIDYIDMTKPWYITKANDAMNICGLPILAYSDECLNAYLQSICVFFNMNLVHDNNEIESPYSLVDKNEWTIDKFYESAEKAISDVNGDGLYVTDDGDVFGIVAEVDSFFPSMWIGADTTVITKDKTNVPMFSAHSNKKLIGILEDLEAELKSDGFFCDSNKEFHDVFGGGDAVRNTGTAYFAEGGSLFRVGCVGYIQLLRDMESNFGVVPLPKYDEKQKEFLSRMCDGWLHVAPATVRDTKLLGSVLESLGAESKNYVIPAFFDIALENKYIRDEDRESTEKMLSMIFDNATIDLSDNVWHEIAGNIIIGQVATGQGGYASALASQYTAVSTEINETVEQIKALKQG